MIYHWSHLGILLYLSTKGTLQPYKAPPKTVEVVFSFHLDSQEVDLFYVF